jgi:hypothetical protein
MLASNQLTINVRLQLAQAHQQDACVELCAANATVGILLFTYWFSSIVVHLGVNNVQHAP